MSTATETTFASISFLIKSARYTLSPITRSKICWSEENSDSYVWFFVKYL